MPLHPMHEELRRTLNSLTRPLKPLEAMALEILQEAELGDPTVDDEIILSRVRREHAGSSSGSLANS